MGHSDTTAMRAALLPVKVRIESDAFPHGAVERFFSPAEQAVLEIAMKLAGGIGQRLQRLELLARSPEGQQLGMKLSAIGGASAGLALFLDGVTRSCEARE